MKRAFFLAVSFVAVVILAGFASTRTEDAYGNHSLAALEQDVGAHVDARLKIHFAKLVAESTTASFR